MQNLEDIIYQTINNNLDCSYLDVTSDGVHFDLVVVSDAFKHKTKVDRHRLVYHALGDKMKKDIHALAMKLYTEKEWQIIHG